MYRWSIRSRPRTPPWRPRPAFADAIRAGADARDRLGAVPVTELAEFDRYGFPALTVPIADGGSGLGPAAVAEVTRLVAAADPAIAQVPQSHYLAVDVLRLIGTDAQRAQAFAVVVDGGRIQPVLAERGAQHAQLLRTRLVRRNGGLVLEGVKYYCTGASTAAWLAVSALDEDDRLVLALVDRHAAGVTIDDDWRAMGQRATVSGTTVLDGVAVDPALVLPYQDVYATPQVIGARAQLTHTAIEVGIAEGALADAQAFVVGHSRPSFEAVRSGWATAAAEDPYTIHHFGRLVTRVSAARQLLRWAAAVLEEIGLVPSDAEDAAPRVHRRRPGQGLCERCRGRRGQRPVRAHRDQRDVAGLRARPALAQCAHPLGPRSGRLEVPPHRCIRAVGHAPAAPRPDLTGSGARCRAPDRPVGRAGGRRGRAHAALPAARITPDTPGMAGSP